MSFFSSSLFGGGIADAEDHGRWAAKEAVKKAFPQRNLAWHDVVIERKMAAEGQGEGSRAPVALVKDGKRGWEEVAVSISHDGEYATATCIGHLSVGKKK